MNVTFSHIIETLAQATEDLKNKKIDVNTAKQICTNTQTLINAAKLQFEVIKHFKDTDNKFFISNVDSSIVNVDSKKIAEPQNVDSSVKKETIAIIDKNKYERPTEITDYRKQNSEFKNKSLQKDFRIEDDDDELEEGDAVSEIHRLADDTFDGKVRRFD